MKRPWEMAWPAITLLKTTNMSVPVRNRFRNASMADGSNSGKRLARSSRISYWGISLRRSMVNRGKSDDV